VHRTKESEHLMSLFNTKRVSTRQQHATAQDRSAARRARSGIFDSLVTSAPSANLGKDLVLTGARCRKN
jgi:hypothetical protein